MASSRDRNLELAFPFVYGRWPSDDELAVYDHALSIERWRSFNRSWLTSEQIAAIESAPASPDLWAQLGPTREAPEPKPAPTVTPANGTTVDFPVEPEPIDVPTSPEPESTPADTPPRRRRGRRGCPRGAPARARELLRGQLASGPKPAAQIEADAEALDFPPRC